MQYQLLAEELASTEFAFGDAIPVSGGWQAPAEFAFGDAIPVSAAPAGSGTRRRRTGPSRPILRGNTMGSL